MTAQAAQNLPFPRFSRPAFGFSSKRRVVPKTEENDEDWYIPYNGPYEAPRELPNRRKARDSWGDPLELDDEEDTLFNAKELHLRYGGHNDPSYGHRHPEGERMGRRRDRTLSVTSGQTESSGTIDPSRSSTGYRRSTVSAGTRHVLPSYISMDAAGGVGESPIPPRRSSQERNRTTLAGIFSFNAHSRKPPSSTHTAASTLTGSSVRKSSLLQRKNVDPPARCSSSSEHANSFVKDKHQKLRHQVMLYADRLNSVASDTDYYNSYYSTLVHEQRSDVNHHRHPFSPSLSEDLHHSQQPPFDQSRLDRQKSSSTRPVHPYARAIPRNNVEIPSKAPPIPPRRPATSHHPNNIKPSSFTRVTSQRSNKLRNSTSTPDLRYSAVLQDDVVTPGIRNVNLIPQPIARSQFVFPKAKDRWISAETWCDALLFPRPRLKSGIVPILEEGSGRIVSPPGSPVDPSLAGSTGTREPGVASRVLAHSRSLMDLNTPHASTSVAPERDPRAGVQFTTFAQDDLPPPTPVPSLRRVLEQGEQLVNERRAWQLQAQSSFGNKQARTLVKSRSKSLANGRRRGHQAQTSLDYLAAQACLGNQNLHPSLSTTDLYTTNASSSRKISHSKNTSLPPTLSRSSKSHSRNHSRGDSGSKPALKLAMSTAAICGLPATEDEVTVQKTGNAIAASLEGAIQSDGTKVIRLADPVHLPVDSGFPVSPSSNSSLRLSSSPSNGSDRKVGIALGTPPAGDDQIDSSFHPSHPYAKGGLSFSVPGPSNQTRTDRGVEFAGPHPSVNSGVDVSQIPDALARHKLPPHLYLHPYGQRYSRDSYLDQNGLLAHYRSGDETPHQNKMWAQLSPGVLREVLPNDIQYSPFAPLENNISPVSTDSPDFVLQINDTIGVGETLARAESVRRSQGSKTGTNDAGVDVIPKSQVDGDKQSQNSLPELEPRTIRQPNDSALSEDSPLIIFTPLKQQSFTPLSLSDRAVSTSPTATSTSSSPPLTPHRLGSPNDLESFQDLFYRPNNDLQRTPNEAALPDTPSPPHFSSASWDRSLQRHKAESGLTTLARQLSQEFELMTRERERRSSQHSSMLSSPRQQSGGGISRQPTVGSLEFVFEEASHSEPVPELDRHAIQAFKPSDSLPEDVESSCTSSVIETTDAEDETAMLRVGVVESISTPATVSPQHRPNSYSGETTGSAAAATNNESRRQPDRPSTSATVVVSGEARARTGLIPPVSEATRSSYMTTNSTASRMSDLSDFPVPPKDHRISLGTYFNEPLPPPPPSNTEQQQLIFGRDQDAGDLAKTLSSSS